MTVNTRVNRFFAGLAAALLLLVAGYLVIRPWHLRWGATDEEVARPMPGDLVGSGWTRAVTIEAEAEAIWPWLVQWGQGRGGWYSYDWLENLLGFDIHTAAAILPEHQNPQVGDPICMARGVCISQVSIVEPHRYFGWQSLAEDGSPAWSFTLGLYPLDGGRTRLVLRESFSQNAMPAAALAVIEIPDVVMEQKALQTVKHRAEGRIEPAYETAIEIGAWLGALALGLAAGWLALRRLAWRPLLLTGLAAVLVLLVLTFTFPPLWLRLALDAALLAVLLWARRYPA